MMKIIRGITNYIYIYIYSNLFFGEKQINKLFETLEFPHEPKKS